MNNEILILEEGVDLTSIMNIIKYEKPEPICADAIGGFPTNLVPMTDEHNLLNYGEEVLNEFRGKLCYITKKADGSSCTIIYQNGKVSVCSRRLEQKERTGFWIIVDNIGLPERLITLGKNIAIQAEAVGPGIQGNRMGLDEKTLLVFNIRDLDTGKWYDWDQIVDVCKILKIKTVESAWISPVTLSDKFIFDNTWTIERLQSLANLQEYRQYIGHPGPPCEGIVLRPVIPEYSSVLGRQLSVKILNVDYKQ